MLRDDNRIRWTGVVAVVAIVLFPAPWAVADEGDTEEPVYFADRGLKAAVEEVLGCSDPNARDMLRLDSLYAADKRISDLTGLEYAQELSDLNLRGNFISGISALSQLTNLTDLEISQNWITDISPLSKLTNLTDLNLSYNQISDLSALFELTKLGYLQLSGNEISDLSALSELANLRNLYLTRNQISDLSALSELTKLGYLYLTHNQISDLSALSELTKLQYLQLSGNEISDLSALSRLANLTDLYLAHNQISDLSALSESTNLRKLDLSYNEISDLSALSELTKLGYLQLSGNEISDLSALSRLANLTDLYLAYNQISDLSALSELTNLRSLGLVYNQIFDLSALSELTNLRGLGLTCNQISDLAALCELTNLRNLYLSYNQISDLSALSELTNLTNLNLSGNGISDLSALSLLSTLADLDLSRNPLSCTAYCVDIPRILERNASLVSVVHDPQPSDCVCPPLPPPVFFVDASASADSGPDGSSWSRAFKHLQDALEVARYGDEIRVAQGIYRPDQGPGVTLGDRNAAFVLKRGVSVKGGYPGLGMTDVNGIAIDPNQRDPERFETILSGDLAGNDDREWVGDKNDWHRRENSQHVVSVEYVDSTAVLDGFTITAGHCDWGGGGGVSSGTNYSSTPTIANCKCVSNYAGSRGGGLDCFYVTLVDCEFINNHSGSSGGGIYVVSANVQGCLFRHNSAEVAGGGAYSVSRTSYSDCVFVGNSAEYAGALSGYSLSMNSSLNVVTFDRVEVQRNFAAPDEANVGYFRDWIMRLAGDFDLDAGRLDICSVLLEGIGKFNIADQAMLRIVGGHGSHPTFIRSVVNGPGNIEIAAGTQLILEGDAVVNLSGSGQCNPDPNTGGRITVDGSLVVRGNATLESTNIDVHLFDVNTPNDIQYNNIRLKEASTGFGGEFFVADNATIRCNNIVSEGDRYLDLDPDPYNVNHPTIENNRVTVVIEEGIQSSQGTLLELRAKDYDGVGASGAYPVSADSPGFTDDPSENWVLERLVLEPGSKLNLTNRQGFEFQDLSDPYPETVYVRELVMAPGSVLNTALQTLYYQDLVLTDFGGSELARNPADEEIPAINGAQITDIPLLGFSLGIIAMDDPTPSSHNEFDIRVRRRLIDPNDDNEPNKPLFVGSIERLDDDPDIPIGSGGVMEMRTQARGKQAANSVSAKGAFARAGDENITIEFEYMFRADPQGEAELVIYLSDHPEVSKKLVEVARIRPPSPGRPGSIGSDQFAIFSGKFLRGDLNFTRGTYVELELRGEDARCWIDNWDPQIQCQTPKCGDYYPDEWIDKLDYLLLVAEFGLSDPNSVGKKCLDLVPDGCVNTDDLLVWDSSILNACPSRGRSSYMATGMYAGWSSSLLSPQVSISLEEGPLLIYGTSEDRSDSTQATSRLYHVLAGGECTGSELPLGNGRIIADSNDTIYQIQNNGGVVQCAPERVIVPQQWNVVDSASGCQVSIGFNNGRSDDYGRGVPLLDAAFGKNDPCAVYVAPVRVVAPGSHISYLATAKLRLDDSAAGYTVEEVYGLDPSQDADQKNKLTENAVDSSFSYEPDEQHIREIEVDAEGYIYVLSSLTKSTRNSQCKDNHILVYQDGNGSVPVGRVSLNDLDLINPSAMVVSSQGDRLYLVSSGNVERTLQARVYRFDIEKNFPDTGIEVSFMDVLGMDVPEPLAKYESLSVPDQYTVGITAMVEDPDTGTVYATGFTAPRFVDTWPSEEDVWSSDPIGFFTTPFLLRIDPDGTVHSSQIIDLQPEAPLLLPLSMVWIGRGG